MLIKLPTMVVIKRKVAHWLVLLTGLYIPREPLLTQRLGSIPPPSASYLA